jgi:iron complex transport system permease protein
MQSIQRRGEQRVDVTLWLFALSVLLLLCIVVAASLGAYRIRWADVLANTGSARGVLLAVRMPRVTLAVLVGGALGAAGAALQGLFRNPLADPGLIGVTSGASLGAVAIIVLAGTIGASTAFALPLAAMAGALGVTLLVWHFARHEGSLQMTTLLLAGIALNSASGAVVGVLTAVSTDQQLRGVTFWLMGSLGAATWPLVLSVIIPIGIGTAILMGTGRELNVMALGERDGFHLGLNVNRVKNRVVAGCAIAVAGAVCAAGGVGFIGLVVPHIARMLLGADQRIVIPASALLGATVLIAADLVARVAIAPAELPVGAVTALVGAPFFLLLLFRARWENARA